MKENNARVMQSIIDRLCSSLQMGTDTASPQLLLFTLNDVQNFNTSVSEDINDPALET